MITINTNQSWW